MTRLLVDPATDFDDPAAVTLSATLLDPGPALVRTFEGVTAGTVVDLPAPDATSAWRLTARRAGRIVTERTVHWTGTDPLAWAALTDVDPATLKQPAGSPLLDIGLDDLRTTILGGASAAYDTLKELEDALKGDDTALAGILTTLGTKLDQAAVDARISTRADPAGAAASAVAAVTLTGLGGLPRQGFQGYRARDFPGVAGIPTVGTGSTQTLSAPGAASSIASALRVQPSKDYVRVVGLAEPKWGTTFPDYQGWKATAYYPNGNTSAPPFALEYELDTVAGVVELVTKGSGTKVQTLVNGQYVAAAPVTIPNDGGGYLIAVNLGAGGRYRIRHEFEGNGIFFGLNVGPTDAVTAAPRRTVRAVWMGDSFGEPTISDTGNVWGGLGLPTVFGWLTGWEVIHASKGGTGLVNAGSAVKFADRLADVLGANAGADVFLLQLSSNDSSATTSAFMAQLQSIIGTIKAAGFSQYGQLVVLGHWWAKQSQAAPSSTLDQNAQAKAWCRANGVVYVDTLTPDVAGGASTTVAGAASPGQSVLSIAAPVPATAVAPNAYNGEYYVQVGNPGSATIEVRKVATSGYSGAGPYNLNLTTALSYAHAVGEQVVQVGASPITGTGTITAPTGSGNADRMVGSDGTHPTVAGHRWRAITYVARLAQAVNR